jgi:hypothetical protein
MFTVLSRVISDWSANSLKWPAGAGEGGCRIGGTWLQKPLPELLTLPAWGRHSLLMVRVRKLPSCGTRIKVISYFSFRTGDRQMRLVVHLLKLRQHKIGQTCACEGNAASTHSLISFSTDKKTGLWHHICCATSWLWRTGVGSVVVALLFRYYRCMG